MRAVAQRVRSAGVSVEGRAVAAIGPGLCAYVGVGVGDGPEDTRHLADRLAHLRIFPRPGGPRGRMAVSLLESGGALLLVPQFTLYADLRHGRRPDFTGAEEPARARVLLADLAAALRGLGVAVGEGVFGADMEVTASVDGPVTILLDSRGGGSGGRARLGDPAPV